MLGESTQHKTTHSTVLCIRDSKRFQLNQSDRKQISDCLGQKLKKDQLQRGVRELSEDKIFCIVIFSSVQFSCSVVSNSLWPHGLQHARLPCPSPTPGACLNSCPFSQWCHPTISSSVVPFSSCLQSFPASGSFLVNQFFASGGQSIDASALASNEYSELISFRMDWFNPFAVQGTLKNLF